MLKCKAAINVDKIEHGALMSKQKLAIIVDFLVINVEISLIRYQKLGWVINVDKNMKAINVKSS